MVNKNLKYMVVVLAMISMTACAQKTSQTTEDNSVQQGPPPQGQGQRQGRPKFSDLLSKMDTNKDGKLTLTEAKGPLKDNFAQIDKDKDGFITETEFNSAPPPPRRQK
jgi:Ca2+-binding EF-hand superfamily protein